MLKRVGPQAPVPTEIIDKGLPTSGLLAHVLVAKHSDHLPLYRQEAIFERAGLAIPRSTLAAWVGVCGVRLQPLVDAMKAELLALPVLHADETPVAMLAPGTGKTHRAYRWAYASGAFEAMRAVVYDFTESRSGQHPRTFFGHGTEQASQGNLVCDDYSGYEALFLEGGITEVGCMAHARRKFVELHLANKSTLAATALEHIGQLYGIEREVKALAPDDRLRERRTRAAPIAKALHDWLLEFRPVGHGQGDGLQPPSLGSAHALPRRPCLAHRQQLRRAADTAMGHRTQELAFRRNVAGRATSRGAHEPHPDCEAQWA